MAGSLASENWTLLILHEDRGQPLHSNVSISVQLGSLYCKLKRMISCTLWSTRQSSNTSYFGHFIPALPSDIYSNVMLWLTVALSGKYQHCFSLNSALNLTQVNCYCWQSAGCAVKASWHHDKSFLHELVWCRYILAKDWRHRDPDSAFSTGSHPCRTLPKRARGSPFHPASAGLLGQQHSPQPPSICFPSRCF